MSFGVRVIPTVRVVSSLLVSTTPLSHRYFIYKFVVYTSLRIRIADTERPCILRTVYEYLC